MTLVIAFDCGFKNTGIVVGLLTDANVDVLRIMNLQTLNLTTKEWLTDLKKYVEAELEDYMTDQTYIVYENCVYGKNLKLKNINKSLHDYFKARQCRVIVLQPSQKVVTKDKKTSEAFVRNWLMTHKPTMLEKFDSFTRRHDVADALQMVLYIQTHPETLKQKNHQAKVSGWKRQSETRKKS